MGYRDANTGSELAGAHLRELTVSVEGEQVVTRGDANASARREPHFEDPISRPFVPPRDRVVADLERRGIEGNDKCRQSFGDDLTDRPRSEPLPVVHEHRLTRRKTRMDQKP